MDSFFSMTDGEDRRDGRPASGRPFQEVFDELVADGIVDVEGNVLVSMPTFGPDDDDQAVGGREAVSTREAT